MLLTDQIEESFLRCTKPIGQGFEINCDQLLLENHWIQKQVPKTTFRHNQRTTIDSNDP